jgi:hypothetical protein
MIYVSPLSLEPGSFLPVGLGFAVTPAGWEWEKIPGVRTLTDVLRAPASGIATCAGIFGVRIVISPYSDIGLVNAAVELEKALNDEGVYAIRDSNENISANTIHIQIGVKPYQRRQLLLLLAVSGQPIIISLIAPRESGQKTMAWRRRMHRRIFLGISFMLSVACFGITSGGRPT